MVSLVQLRSLDKVASSVEYMVPIAVIGVMLVLWLAERNEWVRRLAKAGFVDSGKRLLQAHDPSDNVLMAFVKEGSA